MLRRLLRAVAPAWAIAALGRARRSVEHAVAGGAAVPLRVLPLRSRVLLKARLGTAGRLDYAAAPIRLAVDSEVELGRLYACRKEPETVAWIERFVRPGDVLFDIGANVGAYSLVAHRATDGACTVYAFEPSFSTFAQLSRNVALNGCEGRVIPVPFALSDANGLLTFNYSSLAPGAALHALGPSVDSRGRAFVPALAQPVLAYRLDDFVAHFAGGTPPNHIKLDVDGGELQVLDGAPRTLANPALRTILVEIEPAQPGFEAVVRRLTEAGFEEHARRHHGAGADSVTNFIFVRRPGPGPR